MSANMETAAQTVETTAVAYADDTDVDPAVLQAWKDHPYAVGLTPLSWNDEPFPPKTCGKLSGLFCRLGCGRIGNMVTCCGGFVLGPFWPVLFCLTVPVFVLLSFWTLSAKLLDQHIGIIISWGICTFCLFSALFMTSCSNPGLFKRHSTPLEESWIWNDQALTFRPNSARYDRECAVVIEEFDHVCPWTGTAIGKGNIRYFRIFVLFVPVALVYNAIILTML